eukprot:g23306.t1
MAVVGAALAGSPVYSTGTPAGSGLILSGAPVAQVIPGPVPSLGASTPLSPVPAAFLSGHSVGTPVPVVPQAAEERLAAVAAKASEGRSLLSRTCK